MEPAVRELFGPNCVPENLKVEFRVLEHSAAVGVDTLRRETSRGIVGVGQLGELFEDRLG